MMPNKIKQQGVALIQVLLISAVLSLLAVQLNKSAKINTKLTTAFAQKTAALINLRDAESFLYYQLLTKEANSSNQLAGLNYYGESFQLNDNTTVTIQDTAGLNNLHYPNKSIIEKWLYYNNLDENLASSVINQLKDWQDKDNEALIDGAESETYAAYGYGSANVKLSSVDQLNYLLALNSEQAKSLADISTVNAYTAVNPYHFPQALLLIHYGAAKADQIMELRATNEITRARFTAITGDSEDEDKSFSISPYFKITIIVEQGHSKLTKQSVIELVSFFKPGQAAVSKLYTKIN